MNPFVQVRVTGILVEDERLLLVKQKVSDARERSLPEETGLITKVVKLLHVCDVPA